jgi:hypothetical protein
MRDISKDRAILAAAAPGVWEVLKHGYHDGYDVEGPEPGLRGAFAHEEDALFCVAAHNEIVPYYLSRCEHLERMVDAAIEEIVLRAEEGVHKGPCPTGGWGCAKLGDLRKSKNFNEEHDFCRQCWSDYLAQKVKEAQPHA